MSRKPPPRYRPDRWDYELGWRWYGDACEEQALAEADARFGPLAPGFSGCEGTRHAEGPGPLRYCGVSMTGEIVDGRARSTHFKRHPNPPGSVAAWWDMRDAG